LLGRDLTPNGIKKDVAEIEKLLTEIPNLNKEINWQEKFESWAEAGAAVARHEVYKDGELLKWRVDGEGVLQAPPEYAKAAGRVARIQNGKAGVRLAITLGVLFP
jgi:hypothetical protein